MTNGFLQTRIDTQLPANHTLVLELYIESLAAPDAVFLIGTNTKVDTLFSLYSLVREKPVLRLLFQVIVILWIPLRSLM
jgi:hypothetical protein